MENFDLKGFAKGKKQQKEQIGGNAIIYTRVSSSEQVDGQSLEVQIDKCREYAKVRSYTVVGEFGGTYESAKSDKERKEFNRMLAFIKQSNKKGSSQPVKTVIVFSTSRFSRTGSTTIIEEVEARGAYVVSATSNYDPRTPVGKYMQLMELANARFQNDEKRATTIENSERNAYNHLYWYNINGNLIKQVTSGSYEVQDFLGYDPENGSFYYSSNEESPLRSAIYKIDRKGKKTKLSSHIGTNNALFSTDMKYFMNRYSSLDIPTVITLNDNNGKTLTTLVDNAALKQKLNGYDMPKKEFFSFQTSEGTELNGWMIKPANFSASKKYPVLMYQYSGPGSQQVLDKFGVSWETYMASQGYVVVCVDGRGTGGRGAEFAKSTYLNLGVKEAKDQVETALYLGRQPYVDKNRIGIWGWSYGGYMTIMSMSEGTPVFKAGAAVAPVTDWNYYDTVYGERFMRTPKENAEGYKASSAFTRANNLHGNLLLVHGMADDNVHFQNCAEYAEHLVQLGKQFDMQVYTNRNHSIFGGNTRLHLYTKLTNFFNRELKK